MKSRNLETLTAGMRKKLSWADIEETIKKDPKVKLPDRRALTLWNGFDLSRFRGVEEDGEAEEDRDGTCRSGRPRFERPRKPAMGMWSNWATSRRHSTPMHDASI